MHIFLSIKLGVILHYNICTDLSIQVFCYGKWIFHKFYTFCIRNWINIFLDYLCNMSKCGEIEHSFNMKLAKKMMNHLIAHCWKKFCAVRFRIDSKISSWRKMQTLPCHNVSSWILYRTLIKGFHCNGIKKTKMASRMEEM